MTRAQVFNHVTGHRGELDVAGLLLVVAPIALVLLAWWAGVR
jgi:hypothetical protein